MKKTNIAIIGATGSVGKSALSIITKFKELFNVTFLAAESNYKLLAEQAKESNVTGVVLTNHNNFSLLKIKCESLKINANLYGGKKALLALTKQPDQVIIIANNGIAALDYIIAAIEADNTIILANKEALVSAGEVINLALQKSKAKIIPADSEHNAIYQLLEQNFNKSAIAEIILTASGGPFYNFDDKDLQYITKKEAIKHPNWSMGEIISVNSATLVNKALEIIEAYYLFNLEVDKINAVYHPQSLIHGMVKYSDGNLNMVAYKPSMQVALAYALAPKNRLHLPELQCQCYNLSNITIEEIKPSKTKPITLAKEAIIKGGNALCVFNMANEVAVNAFLLGKINFLSIIKVIEHCLNKIPYNKINNITDVNNEAIIAKNVATTYINSLS